MIPSMQNHTVGDGVGIGVHLSVLSNPRSCTLWFIICHTISDLFYLEGISEYQGRDQCWQLGVVRSCNCILLTDKWGIAFFFFLINLKLILEIKWISMHAHFTWWRFRGNIRKSTCWWGRRKSNHQGWDLGRHVKCLGYNLKEVVHFRVIYWRMQL